MAINTSGLSGYAKDFAEAINSGKTVDQATAAANKAAYSNEAGPQTDADYTKALAGSGFNLIPGTGGLVTTGKAQNLLPTGTSYSSILPATNVSPVQSIYDMIAGLKAPSYEKPDYSSIIPAAVQGQAITANPSETSFLPTSSYLNRAQQYRQLADQEALNTYNANLGQYNAAVNQISDLTSLLPYSTLTKAQEAEAERSRAAAQLDAQLEAQKAAREAQQLAEEQRQFDLTYGLQKKQTEYEIGKPYYNPNTGNEPTQTEKVNTATAKAYNIVENGFAQGYTADQIISDIYSQSGDLKTSGVNIDDLIKYVQNRELYYNGASGASNTSKQTSIWQKILGSLLG